MVETERKQFITQTFNTVAPGYDKPALRFFQQSAAQLPRYFKFQGNEHVLDAATGTGVAALEMASALPRGRVMAVDMSEGMLAQAKSKATLNTIKNVDFSLMDIENLSFANNTFDHVNCSFGLFFLEEMQTPLQHMIATLKSGGKFISCCFTEDSFQPHTRLFCERIRRFGVNFPEEMGFMRLADEAKSTALYASVNLKNIETHRFDTHILQKNAEEWWDVVWHAGFRGFVEQLAPAELVQFKQEHLEEIGKLSNEKGIPFKVEIIFTVGEK